MEVCENVAYLLYVLVSAAGGLLVGVLGTGSSLLLLPSLAFIFAGTFSDTDSLRLAAGTTMATMAVGALAGALTRYRAGDVDVRLLRLMMLPYIAGSLVGPWISRSLPTEVLGIYIGLILAVVALRMLLANRSVASVSRDYRGRELEISIVLLAVGICSSVAGVASGVFAIPYLARFALPMRTIIGTSTAAAAIYSTFGAIGYVSAGWSAANLPAGSFGYVYLPAFAILALTAAAFTPLGVRLARRLNDKILRRFFALFLLIAAIVIAFM
ncbi:MAG: sulfite exporter TauE/SafE family protein [Betaproteobacteria bacterium]|nr:MAG: sulfite exporter TauE/SafE family protein [Betaproteobacteria bacterium]